MPVDGVELLLHFGMTGLLRWDRDDGAPHRHARVTFVCEGGELRYNNMRRFGGVWLASDERERSAVTGPLGPDSRADPPRYAGRYADPRQAQAAVRGASRRLPALGGR